MKNPTKAQVLEVVRLLIDTQNNTNFYCDCFKKTEEDKTYILVVDLASYIYGLIKNRTV
jgi:hypothetical protein